MPRLRVKSTASLFSPAADFLTDFRYPNHLPLPSWDLWEERRGPHLFTTAAVVGALSAASELAGELGEAASATRWAAAAQETRAALLLLHFWDDEMNCFARMVTTDAEGNLTRDMTCDASAYALVRVRRPPCRRPESGGDNGPHGAKALGQGGRGRAGAVRAGLLLPSVRRL